VHCRKRVENEDVGWANNLVGICIHTPAAMECAGPCESRCAGGLAADVKMLVSVPNRTTGVLVRFRHRNSRGQSISGSSMTQDLENQNDCVYLYIYEDPGMYSGVYSRQTFLGRRTGNLTWDVRSCPGLTAARELNGRLQAPRESEARGMI
jgi:hypothetical protein